MRWRIGLGEDRGLGGSQVESVRAVASSPLPPTPAILCLFVPLTRIGCGPRTGRQDRPSPGLLMKQISLLPYKKGRLRLRINKMVPRGLGTFFFVIVGS